MRTTLFTFIIESFTSPAFLFSWLTLLSFFALILIVPVIMLFNKNKWGYFSALGLALVPVIIGVSGMLRSLNMVFKAINFVPEAQKAAALAAGKAVAISSAYFGIMPTVILWIAAVVCFAISSRINQTTKTNQKPYHIYAIDGRTRLIMLYISASIIPLLMGATGWLYGTIYKLNAFANMPAAQKEAAMAHGQSFLTISAGAGITLTVVGLLLTIFIVREKSSS